MATTEERINNRMSVQWKINDIFNQFNEIELLIEELALSDSDINFLSNVNTLKSNLSFYFANWKRGGNEDV